jgi:hypothetical protein
MHFFTYVINQNEREYSFFIPIFGKITKVQKTNWKILTTISCVFYKGDMFLATFIYFGQVVQTCHLLMLNSSWDACTWHNIINLN